MDDDVIGSAALGGEGGFDIGVGNVLVARNIKAQGLGLATRIADFCRSGLRVNRDHFTARAIDPPRLAVVAGEPDAVAGFEFERLRRERLTVACAPLPQAPIDLAPVF